MFECARMRTIARMCVSDIQWKWLIILRLIFNACAHQPPHLNETPPNSCSHNVFDSALLIFMFILFQTLSSPHVFNLDRFRSSFLVVVFRLLLLYVDEVLSAQRSTFLIIKVSDYTCALIQLKKTLNCHVFISSFPRKHRCVLSSCSHGESMHR